MKMIGLEKRFVNSPAHGRAVAANATELLNHLEIEPGWRYLDVGCGVGHAARAIAEHGTLDVTAVDVDPQQIARAQSGEARSNLRFLTMDATSLLFADGEFDVVASSMTTHHIPSWECALSEMVRVLRPGGFLVYVELIFPRWVARIGRLLPVMGFPTLARLDAVAARSRLTNIYCRQSGMRLHTIYRKQA